ncbi:MAG: hypothetical protein R2712_27975 [Vicinamibacterales bacterium]
MSLEVQRLGARTCRAEGQQLLRQADGALAGTLHFDHQVAVGTVRGTLEDELRRSADDRGGC